MADTFLGLPLAQTLPDGTKIYADPSSRTVIRVPPGAPDVQTPGNQNFQVSQDGGQTWTTPGNAGDVASGLGNTISNTINDYVDTSGKIVGAATAITGLIDPSAYGYGGGGSPVPSVGNNPIPPEFGQSAVDTVNSPPPGLANNPIPSDFGKSAVDTVNSPSPASSLPDWLKIAGDVGQSLGANAAGRAAGRNLDNIANIGFAQAQNQLYNTELGAPGRIAGNAVRGDILSNARDVSLAAPSDIPVPTISGGLRPSMFSDTTRNLGRNITANAAATPLPIATPPVLQPMETAGTGDTILNTAGTIGNLLKIVPPSAWSKIGSGIAGLF